MNDFTQGNPAKQIISFAMPMLLGNIFQQMYSMVDAVIVGRYIGGDALAAVGTSGPILMFSLSVLMGLTTGASVVISQYYGAGQAENLRRTVSTSILFLAGLVLVVSVAGYAFSPSILRALNVPENIFGDSVAYLRIMIAGFILMLYYNLSTAYLRALGDSRYPLYFLIAASVMNVVLDLLFVAVLDMGVAGAAWATIIAQAVSAVLCFVYINARVPLLRLVPGEIVFDKKILVIVLKYSVPTAIQLSMTSFASLTIQRLMNSFGSVSIAGFTAATKIDAFAVMPISAISMAISTFVAQNMGAGLPDRAKKGLRSAMILSLAFAVIISAAAVLFGRQLIALFVTGEDTLEILRIGAEYLSVMAVFYFLFAIFFSFNGFFRGSGDAVIVMVLTITSLTIRSVCAHVLVYRFGFGPTAVAWSIPVGWGLCSALCWIYYKRGMWEGKVAIRETHAESKA